MGGQEAKKLRRLALISIIDYAAGRKAVQMAVATISELMTFAVECYSKAKKVAIDIKLPDIAEAKRFSEGTAKLGNTCGTRVSS